LLRACYSSWRHKPMICAKTCWPATGIAPASRPANQKMQRGFLWGTYWVRSRHGADAVIAVCVEAWGPQARRLVGRCLYGRFRVQGSAVAIGETAGPPFLAAVPSISFCVPISKRPYLCSARAPRKTGPKPRGTRLGRRFTAPPPWDIQQARNFVGSGLPIRQDRGTLCVLILRANRA